jgi:hypothetical protein
VRLTGLLPHTDKAVVAAGTRAGTPVVAKLLTTDQPYWIAGRDHELAMCRRFDTDPPPVPAPPVIAHDDRLNVLIHLAGARLHDRRHLHGDLTRADAATDLDSCATMAWWITGTQALWCGMWTARCFRRIFAGCAGRSPRPTGSMSRL